MRLTDSSVSRKSSSHAFAALVGSLCSAHNADHRSWSNVMLESAFFSKGGGGVRRRQARRNSDRTLDAARQTSKEVRHADASSRLQLGRNLRKLRNVMFKVIFIRAGRSIRGSRNPMICLQLDVRKPAAPESIMQHACGSFYFVFIQAW